MDIHPSINIKKSLNLPNSKGMNTDVTRNMLARTLDPNRHPRRPILEKYKNHSYLNTSTIRFITNWLQLLLFFLQTNSSVFEVSHILNFKLI